jgi:two-component system, cell cycle sensor histidine kinase and response regulator CckA
MPAGAHHRARFVRSLSARSPAQQYGVALLLCGLATGFNFAFPAFSSQVPLLSFFIATSVTAWLGGFRAGLLASLVSLLAVNFWFLLPNGFLSNHGIGLIRLLGIGLVMVGISWLIDFRARSWRLIEMQREQAEEQQRRHQAIVSSAARIAGMGSWEYNIAEDKLVWDDETLRIFGITRQAFGGNAAAFLVLVHPDDLKPLQAMQAKALGSNGIVEMEYRILRPDGTIRLVCDRGQVIRYEAGKPVQSIGMVMDVTEQRKTLEDLRESKERYDAAVLGSESGLWDWNLLTNQVFYAPRFRELLGYKEDEFPNVLGSFLDRLHPEDRAAVELAFNQHLKERTPFNVEYRLQTKTGEYRWFNARAQALWDAEGKAYRMAGSIVDISERMLLEERYHQSQRLEAVGRLAGGIAHDFNNMLGVILIHCESLGERLPVNSPEWQSVKQIQTASVRSAALTRQLLAFSRKQILLPRILDLNFSVAEISSMVKSLIGDDIELVIRPSEKLGYVKADPGQIHQVVMNLMVNARDAMPHGGRIVVETGNVQWGGQQLPVNVPIVPGPYVMLSVSDDGCGMEPEVLRHIFEPFFTTKEQGHGTGLGLATVYGIVKQSEGYVVAESEPGKGTTFKIYLPQVEGELAAPVAEPEKTQASGGNETILLAEDEPLLREIFRMQLEGAGYQVLEAQNGDEAAEIAEKHRNRIHLLLTDLVMAGGTNGVELAATLNATQPGIKVVFMTGYTADVIDPKGMADIQDRILQKPFSGALLLRKIREVLTDA